MATFTLIHVLLSVVGILSGGVVVGGLIANRRLAGWTEIFLLTTAATSGTGFGFQSAELLPSHIFGAVTLVLMVFVLYGLYGKGLAGRWRRIYVIGSVGALYLNVFVLLVQLFLKVPAMTELAPTQQEAPFLMTQLLCLAIFVALGRSAAARFTN